MGFSIVAQIIIYIVFHIINAIVTREQFIPIEDERDKLIKLKAIRNSHYAFTPGFVLSIIGLSLGMPIFWIFVIFVISGLFSEIVTIEKGNYSPSLELAFRIAHIFKKPL